MAERGLPGGLSGGFGVWSGSFARRQTFGRKDSTVVVLRLGHWLSSLVQSSSSPTSKATWRLSTSTAGVSFSCPYLSPPPPLHLLPSSAAKTRSHSSLLSKIGSVRRWRRRAAITAGKNAVQSAVHTTTQSCRQSCCSCRTGGGRLTELCWVHEKKRNVANTIRVINKFLVLFFLL